MKLEFSQRIFEKYSNINFHENQSSGSHPQGRTDMTKLMVAFSNFANAPKNMATILNFKFDVCMIYTSVISLSQNSTEQ